jgi:hypothetical protein
LSESGTELDLQLLFFFFDTKKGLDMVLKKELKKSVCFKIENLFSRAMVVKLLDFLPRFLFFFFCFFFLFKTLDLDLFCFYLFYI